MFKFLCKTLLQLRASVGALKSFGTEAIVQENLKSTRNVENKHLFTVNYLKKELGFTPERALTVAKYMKFETPEKPDSVISFLKNHGFTTTQIYHMSKTFPTILLSDPEKTLLPKIEFFQSLGLSNEKIRAMLTTAPQILKRSLEKQIVPSFEWIKGIVQSHEKALDCLRRYCLILNEDLDNNLIANVKCLKDIGVPQSNIAVRLTYQPKLFMVTHSQFSEIVEKVKGMGFSPLRMKFLLAVLAFRAMNKSTWEKKVEIYKRWGCSEDEILEAFVRHPCYMTVSEDKIMAAMDILVNKLGIVPYDVLRRSEVISYSLPKRIIPRSIVYQALSKKGLVPEDLNLISFLVAQENTFLRRFVEPFQVEAPELLALYNKALSGST